MSNERRRQHVYDSGHIDGYVQAINHAAMLADNILNAGKSSSVGNAIRSLLNESDGQRALRRRKRRRDAREA